MTKGSKKGFDQEIFKRAVRLSCGIDEQSIPVQVFDAIVQSGSQNEDEMTCVIDSVDNTVNNLTVRYNLCVSDGEINIPEDESVVTILKTSFTDPYIVRSTDLKYKETSIGNQSWSNDGIVQDFEYYEETGVPSGSFGGFVKSLDPTDPTKGLLKKLNNIENKIDDLITVFSSWIPVPNDGGAALKTALSSWIATSLIPTISSDIENEHIIHGTKNLPS